LCGKKPGNAGFFYFCAVWMPSSIGLAMMHTFPPAVDCHEFRLMWMVGDF